MSFPRYPAYKEGEDPMIGLVPEHWKKAALKHLADYQNGYPFKPDDWGDTGRPIIRIAQLTGDAEPDRYVGLVDERVAVYEGDLLFSWSATLDSFFWRGEPAWLNQHIFKVTPSKQCIKEYLYYLIKFWAPKLADVDAHGSTMRHIKKESLGQRLFVPPLDEQRSISEFLDHETAKIDALVTEQERLIELLKEKRQAVISHAVTKGLDPSVPMKDSGVEWLGEVPAHWEVRALRRVIKATEQGWSPECYAREAEEGEWGVLKAGCVNGGTFRPSENKALPPELSPEASYEVRAGDVLMSRASGSPELVGSTALVATTRERLMLSDKIFRLQLSEAVNEPFFVASLNSRALRIQIENALSGGNGMANNLPQSSLLTFQMAVPPLSEQAAITTFLDQEIARIDALMNEAVLSIELLRERRTALISAAVTGQIDVRGAA